MSFFHFRSPDDPRGRSKLDGGWIINGDDTEFVEAEHVVNLLHRLQREQERLQKWLTGSVELNQVWTDFQHAGGVSADDFKQFLAGEFRYRRIKLRKHLRLVANRKPVVHRAKLVSDDDDAA